jgi:hypothetical protein
LWVAGSCVDNPRAGVGDDDPGATSAVIGLVIALATVADVGCQLGNDRRDGDAVTVDDGPGGAPGVDPLVRLVGGCRIESMKFDSSLISIPSDVSTGWVGGADGKTGEGRGVEDTERILLEAE